MTAQNPNVFIAFFMIPTSFFLGLILRVNIKCSQIRLCRELFLSGDASKGRPVLAYKSSALSARFNIISCGVVID